MKRFIYYPGTLLVILFFVIHIITINDYGFTWDFHFHFFGGGKLLGYQPNDLEPRNLPFVEPDPRRAWTLPYGPIMSIPPVASYLLLYRTLHILPPDSAYHLPIILWGVIGIGVLYLFMKQAFSTRVAWLAALILGLTPRYFGDLHNNMKDIPSAVSFALNMWLLWRLVRYKRPTDLLWAIVGFAVAFNVKINSIFIPIIFIVWLFFLRLTNNELRITNYLKIYFLASPLAAFFLWWVFWPDPIGQLLHAYRTFGIGTNNIEVLLNGHWYCSGSTVPWYYPYWYLVITTPLPILIGCIIGLISSIMLLISKGGIPFCSIVTWPWQNNANVREKGLGFDGTKTRNTDANIPITLLIILWLLLPLTRYLIPTIGVIDGIRHFEEVLFPIAALSAIGTDVLMRSLKNKLITSLIFLFTVFYLLCTNYSYHPYQITYFNELVGGVKGATGKYDLDYWGTSQKAAVEWVNMHALQNAKIHIVMAGAVAGQYLRPDLTGNLNKYSYDDSDFVILLNRQSFLYRFFYAYEYLLRHKATHTITVNGAPLVWIFDNRTDNKTPRQTPWWQGEDPCIIKYW